MRLAGIGIVCKSGRGGGGEILGGSRPCLPIWSKKQVESAGTVVQGYVGGLLRQGGEPR